MSEAMWLILQHDEPDDFVIATNETHTIQEFVERAFNRVGLNWENHVVINEKYKRPVDVNYLKGNYSKSKQLLGWIPKTTFVELADLMIDADLMRWTNWQNGIHFSWDAWNYPNEKKNSFPKA